MTDQERLEDLQEEIEILQGYKHMHGKLSEENARLRKHIRKAIAHFNQDEHRKGMSHLLKALEDDPNERGKDHQD